MGCTGDRARVFEDTPIGLPRGGKRTQRKEAGDVLPGLGAAGESRPAGNHGRAYENTTLKVSRKCLLGPEVRKLMFGLAHLYLHPLPNFDP